MRIVRGFGNLKTDYWIPAPRDTQLEQLIRRLRWLS